VRDSSHWQTSLREVFQWMNENYAKKGKFFPDSDGVREAAEAVSHANLAWFFAKYVQGTDEIPWDDFFRAVGLRVIEGKVVTADAGFVGSRNFDGPMAVAAVTAGSEAERAGLRVGDIILQINGRIAGQESSQDLVGLTAGDTITVKLRSRGSLERELKWKAGSHEEITYELKNMEKTNAEQMAHRAAWLKGEAQVPPETHSH